MASKKNNKMSRRGGTKRRKGRGRNSLGGKAIAAGGFGCVFQPALKCTDRERTPGVSKLMYAADAAEEMEEVERLRPIILTIPNYEKYFIIHDIDICDPAPLTARDLKNMKICNNFKKHNSELVKKDNINRELSHLKSINIPYGGEDLSKWITFISGKSRNKPVRLAKFNLKLMELISNAVVPMNKKKLFHFDLKAQNILVDDAINLRIIDWGLSAVQTGIRIPNIVFDRPFQFNVPFSNILFYSDMQPWLDTMSSLVLPSLGRQGTQDNDIYSEKLKIIAYNFITQSQTVIGAGHFAALGYFMGFIFGDLYRVNAIPSEVFYDGLVKNIITDYLATIFNKYLIKGKFQQEKYFNEVYKHNVDIWGVLSVYLDVLIELKSSTIKNSLTEQIKFVIIKYMYSSTFAAKKIPINELLHDMGKIKII